MAPRQHPLICTGAGPIHPVHGQPMSLATKAIPETRLHFRHFRGLFKSVSFAQLQTGKVQWSRGLTTLHHFLDTVLPKKRVMRRLAAATAVAQPHDKGRPGAAGARPTHLQRDCGARPTPLAAQLQPGLRWRQADIRVGPHHHLRK